MYAWSSSRNSISHHYQLLCLCLIYMSYDHVVVVYACFYLISQLFCFFSLCYSLLCVALLYVVLVIFFFKQKTAYEMRISDWSSDVCSSDLRPDLQLRRAHRRCRRPRCRTWRRGRNPRAGAVDVPWVHRLAGNDEGGRREWLFSYRRSRSRWARRQHCRQRAVERSHHQGWRKPQRERDRGCPESSSCHRSEEHTSELQSLMRISYAVFCLNKTKCTILSPNTHIST